MKFFCPRCESAWSNDYLSVTRAGPDPPPVQEKAPIIADGSPVLQDSCDADPQGRRQVTTIVAVSPFGQRAGRAILSPFLSQVDCVT